MFMLVSIELFEISRFLFSFFRSYIYLYVVKKHLMIELEAGKYPSKQRRKDQRCT